MWVTDVVSTKPAPYSALSCLTRCESLALPCLVTPRRNRPSDAAMPCQGGSPPPIPTLTPQNLTAFSCFELAWERAFPLSQTNHVRSMERLKRIMEHDELEGASVRPPVHGLVQPSVCAILLACILQSKSLTPPSMVHPSINNGNQQGTRRTAASAASSSPTCRPRLLVTVGVGGWGNERSMHVLCCAFWLVDWCTGSALCI